MKKRNVRWLLASAVAVVSIGAGVSAATSDEPASESAQAAHVIKLEGNKTTFSLRSFGIRW